MFKRFGIVMLCTYLVYITTSHLCTHSSSSSEDVFSQSSLQIVRGWEPAVLCVCLRACISAVRGLRKPLKVAILCVISNKKTSIFITHFSLKVQSGKKLFCLLDQHTTPGRLQYTKYRVQGRCTPLCRCALSGVGERSAFHLVTFRN